MIRVGSPKYLLGSCGEYLPLYAMANRNDIAVNAIETAKNDSDTKFIYYPSDLQSGGAEGAEQITHFVQYLRRSRGGDQQALIQLPLPTNLQNQIAANYEDSSGLFTEAATQFLQGEAASSLTNAVDVLGEAGKALASSTTDALTGGARSLVDRTVVAPRVPVLFKGMNFREYSFEHNLAAKSPADSGQVLSMINTLKDGMLPEEVSNFTLSYPDEFDIAFFTVNKNGGVSQNKFLFGVNRSVMTNFSVNYNGQGTPRFFEEDNAPVNIQISMSFREILIPTRESVRRSEGRDRFSGVVGLGEVT